MPELNSESLVDITPENIVEVLKLYTKELQDANRKGMAAYFVDPLVSVESNILEFTVGSKSLELEIVEEQAKLIQLFKQFGYKLEGVKTKLDAKEISKYKIFTPKQEYDKLSDAHPILKDLEQRFGLDFDV